LHGGAGFRIPGRFADDGPSAVEDQGAEEVAVAAGEGLGEVAAVGVAVEVDLGDGEGSENGGEVVGGEAGAVEIGGGTEGRAAEGDVLQGAVAVGLERFAIDGLGFTGAAIVDQQQVAGIEQGVEEIEVAGTAAGGGVAGAAFDGYDSPSGGLGGVEVGVELEGDIDSAG
jgi:hypothetical protein